LCDVLLPPSSLSLQDRRGSKTSQINMQWTRGLMMNVSFSSWPQQQWVTQSPLSVSTAVSGTEESYANAGRWHWPLWELWYCMALDPSRRLVSSKERLMSPYLHTTASN
jgi:hypothetical protein